MNSLENSYLLNYAQVSGLAALGLVVLYAEMKEKTRWWETVGQMSPPTNPAELTQDVMDLMKARQRQSTDLLSSVCSRFVTLPFEPTVYAFYIHASSHSWGSIKHWSEHILNHCLFTAISNLFFVMSLGILKGECWGTFYLNLPSTSSNQMNQALT